MNLDSLKEIYKKYKLTKVFNKLKPFAKNSIEFELWPEDEEDMPLGTSKVGGIPDLPTSFQWPEYKGRPLMFLAQIKLEDLVVFDLDRKLPSNGMLYFFYGPEQTWGNKEEKGSWKCIYNNSPLGELFKTNHPLLGKEEDTYEAYKMFFESKISLPSLTGGYSYELSINNSINERYEVMREEEDFVTINKVLGYPDNIQQMAERDCELLNSNLESSLLENEDWKVLVERSKRWELLFQLDSDAGFMWGDSGRIYFFILPEDLASKNFEEVKLVLQCG